MSAEDGETVIPGGKMSPEELAIVKQLQDYFAIDKATERLRSYAQWLFTGTTVVSALAAGSAATQPSGGAFHVSVALLGVSLATAGMSLSPHWARNINPASPNTMLHGINQGFRRRRALLYVATILFASALTLAGLEPLLETRIRSGSVGISYTTTEAGVLILTAVGYHPDPVAALQLDASFNPEDQEMGASRARGLVDGMGKSTVELKKHIAKAHGVLHVRWEWSVAPTAPGSLDIALLAKPVKTPNEQPKKE